MAVSIDSGCSKTKDPDMVLGNGWLLSWPYLALQIAQIIHPSGGCSLKMPVCPQVTIIYPGCGRASDTDKALGRSLRLDNTVAPDGCMGLCVCVVPVAAWPCISMDSGIGLCTSLAGNKGHGCQLRAQLQQGYRSICQGKWWGQLNTIANFLSREYVNYAKTFC